MLPEGEGFDSPPVSILQEAFGNYDPEGDPHVQSILGAVILSTAPLHPP